MDGQVEERETEGSRPPAPHSGQSQQVASFTQESCSLDMPPFLPIVCMFLSTGSFPFPQFLLLLPTFHSGSNLGFLKFSLLTKIREDKKLCFFFSQLSPYWGREMSIHCDTYFHIGY